MPLCLVAFVPKSKIMPENPFKLIEPNGQVPESLKKALVSEIDTIRNTSTIIELFVGNFINTLSASFAGDDEIEPQNIKG
ncbi:MAG: hypothetical protein MUF58_13950 [Arcicella sp.]|nr:hypothetical protein [Arcicella sp.]